MRAISLNQFVTRRGGVDTPAVLGGRALMPSGVRDRWHAVRVTDILPIARELLNGVTTDVAGPATRCVEDGFRRLCGTAHALAMNSGTAALHSAYFAVGIRPGDEVIVPSYTFYATATPLLQLGARPVFCEIDPHTLTADPTDVEQRITERTKAICVVHIWGNPAKLDAFAELSRRYHIALIEDCSHAHGATFQGRSVGSFGDVGCFSMQGSKAVSGGEAGIAVTSNRILYQRMLALGHNLRSAGGNGAGAFDPGPLSYGLKYRPHLFAMHLAARSLNRLADTNSRRAANLEFLSKGMGADSALAPIGTYPEAVRGGYLEFIFRYRPEFAGHWSREAFVVALRGEGVPIDIDRYSLVGRDYQHLHEAPVFGQVDDEFFRQSFATSISTPVTLPVTERVACTLVSMPTFTTVPRRKLQSCLDAIAKVSAFARMNPTLR